MKTLARPQWLASALILLTLPALGAKPEPGQVTPSGLTEQRLPVGGDQLLRALGAHEQGKVWKPAANEEISRGPSATVYPKVAPATVVIRVGSGHGTGFVVSEDGWIVTNHHVAVHALTMNNGSAAGTQAVFVHLGHLEDGVMTVDEQSIPALVYKLDLQHDLALLKLTRLPNGVDKLPYVKLAQDRPKPGMSCVVLGHPKAGMLWTIRSGEVAAIGLWPKDNVDLMMNYLSVAASDKETMSKNLASVPQRKVVVSSCGANPGDSGGPLVNEEGELIAVTFAIPTNDKSSEVTLDKFSFHVHSDEVRDFLTEKPGTPLLHMPSIWPASTSSAIIDADEDGKNDSWCFLTQNNVISGVLIDADQDSGPKFKDEFNAKQRTRETWDAELVFHGSGRMFYDKNNDGEMDEVLYDFNNDRQADLAMRKTGDQWAARQVTNRPMLDAKLFDDPALGERAVKVFEGKGRVEAGAKPSAPPKEETPPLAKPAPSDSAPEKTTPVKAK